MNGGNKMLKKPLCAISTCLLGKNVRYDGNHKLDRYVKDQLGQYVNFLPVCPEVECGMPTPRPALRLVDKEGDIRLMTRNEGEDKTPMMHAWMNGRLDELEKLPLCGFIFEGK